jgi:hypothetical protein
MDLMEITEKERLSRPRLIREAPHDPRSLL